MLKNSPVPIWSKKISSSQKNPSGDLIPSSSWGASLANILMPKEWKTLRQAAIDRAKNCCETCGVSGIKVTLEAHEMWSYEIIKEDPKIGVQKLNDIIALCKSCHLCFHLGFARLSGKEPQTLRRLKTLNNWTKQELDDYQKLVWQRWDIFSDYIWFLNVDGWFKDAKVELNNKVKVNEKNNLLLTVNGGGTTAIIGADYRLQKN
jgi:hypothetical protein